jgi:hypothetical protein
VLTTPFKPGPKQLQRVDCISMIRRKKGGRSPLAGLVDGREAGAQDAVILASIALQHGALAAVICHALAAATLGPLAAALDLADGSSS